MDSTRKGKREASIETEDNQEFVLRIADPYPTPEDVSVQRGTRDALVQAIQTLTPDQRDAVNSRYFQDISNKETAENMGKSHMAIRSKIHRGLVGLRNNHQLAKAVGF